jgi:hypothetical protein
MRKWTFAIRQQPFFDLKAFTFMVTHTFPLKTAWTFNFLNAPDPSLKDPQPHGCNFLGIRSE